MGLCPLQPSQGEWPLPFEPHRRDDPSRTLGQGLSAPGTPEQGVTLSLHPPAKGTVLRPPFPLHPFSAGYGMIRIYPSAVMKAVCAVCMYERMNNHSNERLNVQTYEQMIE